MMARPTVDSTVDHWDGMRAVRSVDKTAVATAVCWATMLEIQMADKSVGQMETTTVAWWAGSSD